MYLGTRFQVPAFIQEDHLYSIHTRYLDVNWDVWRQALYLIKMNNFHAEFHWGFTEIHLSITTVNLLGRILIFTTVPLMRFVVVFTGYHCLQKNKKHIT